MQYSVYSILLCTACVATLVVAAQNNDVSTLYDVLSKRAVADTCKAKYGDAVESLFDRVCEVCHSMFAHEAPNLRLNCRSNCYDNTVFAKCSSVFTKAAGGAVRPYMPVRRTAPSYIYV